MKMGLINVNFFDILRVIIFNLMSINGNLFIVYYWLFFVKDKIWGNFNIYVKRLMIFSLYGIFVVFYIYIGDLGFKFWFFIFFLKRWGNSWMVGDKGMV